MVANVLGVEPRHQRAIRQMKRAAGITDLGSCCLLTADQGFDMPRPEHVVGVEIGDGVEAPVGGRPTAGRAWGVAIVVVRMLQLEMLGTPFVHYRSWKTVSHQEMTARIGLAKNAFMRAAHQCQVFTRIGRDHRNPERACCTQCIGGADFGIRETVADYRAECLQPATRVARRFGNHLLQRGERRVGRHVSAERAVAVLETPAATAWAGCVRSDRYRHSTRREGSVLASKQSESHPRRRAEFLQRDQYPGGTIRIPATVETIGDEFRLERLGG